MLRVQIYQWKVCEAVCLPHWIVNIPREASIACMKGMDKAKNDNLLNIEIQSQLRWINM
jgi:hypothetical protein